MITLSESVFKNCVQRPLVDIAPWRQFQFARKHHFLGNSVCWRWNLCWLVVRKCCFLSKSVIENCIQRPLAKLSRRRFSGLQIKTLLCRKRCMIDENFLMNTSKKSGSSYQIPSAGTINSEYPAVERKWHHSYSARKFHYLRNGAWLKVKVVLNTTWHSEFKLVYGHLESWKYHSWSWKPKLYALLAIMSPMSGDLLL